MREIKFRGKSIETGEMVYGSLINNLFFYSKDKSPIPCILPDDNDFENWDDLEDILVEVVPETVGQYTGLKDKNGKEIYEGDIVKLSKSSIYEKIIGDIGWFGWYSPQSYFGLWVKYRSYNGDIVDEPLRICATGNENTLDKIEVIGNCFEHPHLLEGEQA